MSETDKIPVLMEHAFYLWRFEVWGKGSNKCYIQIYVVTSESDNAINKNCDRAVREGLFEEVYLEDLNVQKQQQRPVKKTLDRDNSQ